MSAWPGVAGRAAERLLDELNDVGQAISDGSGAASPKLHEDGAFAGAPPTDEGYDNATYPVTSVQHEADGTWIVFLEHVPPTPPGGHCMVTVSPDGAARLAHGE